jgi:DivIVA domain-containing protein
MKISPTAIRQKSFETSFRGFEKKQVTDFLEEMSVIMEQINQENLDLRSRLQQVEGEAKRRMEELLVQEKALSEAKQRIVELEKNIADLKKLMQNQGAGQANTETFDWRNQTGPLAIAVFVLLAILVLLKL